MKMPIAYVVATLALAAATSGHAASPDKALVWRDYTDTVAPADQQAYEAGVKAFNQCLGEHHVKFSMPTVVHETGNDYQYSSVVGPLTWADMDTLSAEIKPCDATWRAQGNPHLKGETSAFMALQPEMSHLPADWQSRPNPPMLFITYFTLKPGHAHNMAFSDAFKKVAAAASKSKWPYYWSIMQIWGGGDGAPDYILVIQKKNWADVGTEPNPAPWKMMANAYGQSDADAIRKSLGDAIAKSSDHYDRYDASLSYTAGK